MSPNSHSPNSAMIQFRTFTISISQAVQSVRTSKSLLAPAGVALPGLARHETAAGRLALAQEREPRRLR